MGTDKTNHNDEAGKMHAEIVRRDARSLRESQRLYAVILDNRGWDHHRISEYLEVDITTLRQLLAADGRLICTECVFARHLFCDIYASTALDTGPCECLCRSH